MMSSCRSLRAGKLALHESLSERNHKMVVGEKDQRLLFQNERDNEIKRDCNCFTSPWVLSSPSPVFLIDLKSRQFLLGY